MQLCKILPPPVRLWTTNYSLCKIFNPFLTTRAFVSINKFIHLPQPLISFPLIISTFSTKYFQKSLYHCLHILVFKCTHQYCIIWFLTIPLCWSHPQKSPVVTKHQMNFIWSSCIFTSTQYSTVFIILSLKLSCFNFHNNSILFRLYFYFFLTSN